MNEYSCESGSSAILRFSLKIGGYRRLVAIEERVYTRPIKRKSMTFYFVYPLYHYFSI